MEYFKCKSCGKPIASYDEKTKVDNLHIQCKSCKAYNILKHNKVVEFYIKVGKSGEENA